jgi:hypothetical protein
MHRLKGTRLLPQNYNVPDLLNNPETGVFEFGHHKAALILSDEPGVRFQDDCVRALQDVYFMANQVILQAFNIADEIEAGESMVTYDVS